MEEVLWSSKQPCSAARSGDEQADRRNPDPCPLTVVTTLTLSRAHGLEQLCGSWPGPLVAALYVPLDLPVDAARNRERVSNATAAARDLQRRYPAHDESDADVHATPRCRAAQRARSCVPLLLLRGAGWTPMSADARCACWC